MVPRSTSRPIFLKWALLNSLFVVGLVVLGLDFLNRVHGVSLYTIPAILLVAAYGTAYAGYLCWRADVCDYADGEARRLVHASLYLDHWAWVCPMIGILSSIAGMSVLLSSNDAATLGQRVTSGGGGIFYGTFVGVLSMLLLKHEQRMLEHALLGR